MELPGRRVLVTGASRGIGAAVAAAFAAAGADVVVAARNIGAIEELGGRIGATAIPADLADPAVVAALIDRVEAEAGPVDVLVNNAGLENSAFLPEQDAAAVDAMVAVNVSATFHLSRLALPGMLERGRGHIVNVSSLGGAGVFPGLAVYSATKAAIAHFTAGLRADLRGLPVGTTLVELGPIATDMLDTVNAYEPARASYARFYRLRLVVDTPVERVAEKVVDAVRRDRRHVRLPTRAAPLPLLAEAPRRLIEALISGVPPRQD
jgi:short-subunit dehydrogenase